MSAPLILGTNSIKDTGYNVANSVRLDSSSTAYLSRTVNLTQGTTSQHKFTISCWFKLGKTGQTNGEIFGAHGSNDYFTVRVSNGNAIDILSYDNAVKGRLVTNQLLRDHSTWYHIVVACDSNNGSGGNRMRLYLNGSEVTSFSNDTNPSSGTDLIAENMDEFNIGRNVDQVGGAGLFDGYIAEFVYIDNDQLDPTSFGEFDEDSPTIWKPKDVSTLSQLSNTFSFYLDFEDSSNLGNDVSGNNLDFTSNNLTSIDQSTDTCTNNFATFNSLSKNDAGTVTFSEGNLKIAHSGTDSRYTGYSTIAVTQGKWYAEFKYVASSGGSDVMVGIGDLPEMENLNRQGSRFGLGGNSVAYYADSGDKYVGPSNTISSYGDSYTVNDIIGVALDLDNGNVYFSKNGTFQNSGVPTSGSTGTGGISFTTGNPFIIGSSHVTTGSRTSTYSANYGSPPYAISSGNADGEGFGNFEYAVPSGYFALCSKNLAEYG